MRTVDLFAGAGGASLGLRNAGCEIVAAVEWDTDAAVTYRAMLGDHMHQRDIREISRSDLLACDLLHASPPCQGFSYAGKRDKDDPRNSYWYEVLRIVSELRPAWVTMENVRGMLTMGEDKAVIVAFRAIGYELTPHLLCAADYGVPQRRYRVFYVGNRLGLPNPVPPASHAQPPRHLMLGLEPWVTVRQALGADSPVCISLNEPSPTIQGGTEGGGAEPVRHRLVMTHKYSVTEKLDSDGRTSPWYDGDAEPARSISHEPHKILMTDQRNPSNGRSAYYDGGENPARSVRTEPGNISDEFEYAPTIQGDSPVSRPGHHGPGEPRMGLRRLTVRECATLQGFPEWFEFSGSKTSQYRQVGNAVPPAMSEAIARAIMVVSERATLAV